MMKIKDFFLTDLEKPDFLKLFRDWRYLELAQTDWTQLPDAPVDAIAWALYRQKLRDLTDNKDFANAELPERPI